MVETAPVSAVRVSGKEARRRERPASWLLAVLAVLVGTGLIAASAALYGRWIVDDAGITFDFARNIALGNGPVAQASGPLVEGYSDPTWLALLIAGRMLGLFDHGDILGIPDYVAYPKALALLCCAGILIGVYLAARKVHAKPWWTTVVAGVVLAATSSFVIWSFSGLENALYALLVTWLAVVLLRAGVHGTVLRGRIAVLAGILAFLAALTRPDGLIYVLAYPALVLVTLRRPQLGRSVRVVLLGIVAFVVPYGAFLVLRYEVFGQLLPTTAVAKGQSVPSLADLGTVGDLFSYAGWLLVAVAIVSTGIALVTGGVLRRALVGPLVVLVLALLAYGVLLPDWMAYYRFATPVWPVATLVVALAVPKAFAVLRRRAAAILAVLLLGGCALSGAQQYAVAKDFRAHATVPLCAVAEVTGRGFNGLADRLGKPGATLLTQDLGGSSLVSSMHIVDLAGLVNPTVAGYWARHDISGLRDYVFGRVRPTFVKITPGWAATSGLLADPRMKRDYVPLTDGYGPGNFVRRDAVRSPAKLARLRAYQRRVITPAATRLEDAPRSGCGRLVIGQELGGR